jgi:hypothetical protein
MGDRSLPNPRTLGFTIHPKDPEYRAPDPVQTCAVHGLVPRLPKVCTCAPRLPDGGDT